MELYINGTYDNGVSTSGSSGISTKFFIGGDNIGNPTPYKGRFANIALWNTFLTDAQVTRWWNECKADFGY